MKTGSGGLGGLVRCVREEMERTGDMAGIRAAGRIVEARDGRFSFTKARGASGWKDLALGIETDHGEECLERPVHRRRGGILTVTGCYARAGLTERVSFALRPNGALADGFLDYSMPEVQEFYHHCFRLIFKEWGFEAMKLDFWSQGVESASVRFKRGTAVEWRDWLLSTIRSYLPPDGFLETCVATAMGNP